MKAREKKPTIARIVSAGVVMIMCIFFRAPNSTLAAEQKSVGPMDTIRSALRLTDRQRKILAETTDGTGSVEEAGFYLLMGKIAKFPQLTAAEIKQLDAPAYANLLRQPGRYRFRPIRLSVRVFQVEKLTVNEREISVTPYWPSDKPIWALYGLAGEGVGCDEPLIVYSTVEPPVRPRPSKVMRDGREEFEQELSYSIEGVFFKYVKKMDADGKFLRKYPVVLAWQLAAGEPKTKAKNSPMADTFRGGIVLLGVILALAVFIYLKKKLKPARLRWAQQPFGNYHPLRDGKPPGDVEHDADESIEVDPDLSAAAEEYRKEHGTEK